MGSIVFLADFELYLAVLGVPTGPIGLVAPLGFKILDSQPNSSNMGPVPTDFLIKLRLTETISVHFF